jgi:anthranilate phosphoribosyltransferase
MTSSRVLRVETPEQSKAMLLGVLQGEPGAASDIVALNAGAALYAAGVASGIADGVVRAREALASGAALARMHQFVALSQSLAQAA